MRTLLVVFLILLLPTNLFLDLLLELFILLFLLDLFTWSIIFLNKASKFNVCCGLLLILIYYYFGLVSTYT